MDASSHERLDAIKRGAAGLVALVGEGNSKQVQSPKIQKAAKLFATTYFNDARPTLSAELDEPILAPLDDAIQELLELSQKNSLRSSYKTVLKGIQKTLNVVEVAAVTGSRKQRDKGDGTFGKNDGQIIETLSRIVPTAAASYAQACSDLQDGARSSFRGTAAELRESLREVLDHLAPDDMVKDQEGFRLEAGQTKPTMKQKARFILKSRGVSKSVYETPETAIETVDEKIGALARSVYNRSSLSAHVATNRKEVVQIKAYIDVVLGELLELS